jgi:hypothetical protein
MKKHVKSLICVLAILFITAGVLTTGAYAASSKPFRVHSLSKQKWITIGENPKYQEVYKIKVTSDGFLSIYVNNKNVPGQYPERCSVVLCKDYKKYDTDYIGEFNYSTNRIAVPKGTYYLVPWMWEGLKFKWDFSKKSVGSNYCIAKAETPKAGKNQVLYFKQGQEFAKWYKVTLTKDQKIRVFAKAMEPPCIAKPSLGVLITDSNGLKVQTKKQQYVDETGVLKKGTYYIRIERGAQADSSQAYGTRVISFTWNKK